MNQPAQPTEPCPRSQTLAAGLYVVATPIGNLGDMTARARDVLAAADLILCEDTRTSAHLLHHCGITTRTLSFHDHSGNARTERMVERLQEGERIALISDAGTPLLSDPGFPLVRAAHEAGISVFAVPGASSITAALSVSGIACERFFFTGFLPAKAAARAKEIEALAALPATLVVLESPHRLAESLAALAGGLGGQREAAVARELTKMFEEVRRGTLAELAAQYAEAEVKGEIVLVIAPPEASETVDDAALETLLKHALAKMSLKDAVEAVTQSTGCPRKRVYAKALEVKR